MIFVQSLRGVFSILMRYLTVFLPLTLALLLPIYYWGDFLGAGLIQLFGDALGLFLRPLVISMLYIFILAVMLSSRFEKFNQHLWFSRFKTDEIKRIYKTYIYGITSFFVASLIVVLFTLFLGSDFLISWFNVSSYLFGYFLLILALVPLITIIPQREI